MKLIILLLLLSTPAFAQQTKVTGAEFKREYAVWVDSKTANTSGGNSVSGAYRQRVLTTEVFDTGDIGVISGSSVTLIPGVFFCEWSSPFFEDNAGYNYAKTRLYNATTSTILGRGNNVEFSYQNQVHSSGYARFSISVPSDITVQYQVAAGETGGLGHPLNNGEPEIYTMLKCERESSIP